MLPCKHRREEVSPGNYVCLSLRVLAPESGIPESICEICAVRDMGKSLTEHELVQIHQIQRSHTAGLATAPAVTRGLCFHLGEPTGQTQECPTCQGTVKLKLFHCRHPAHPDPVTLHAVCRSCRDYQAAEPPSVAPGDPSMAS